MGNVVNLKEDTLDQVAGQIRAWIFEAGRKEVLAARYRVRAGEALLAAQKRVEAEGLGWEKWCEQKICRSQRDIYRLMALARADDQEAALAEEREKTRNQVANTRVKDRAATGRSLQKDLTYVCQETRSAPVMVPSLPTTDTHRYALLVSAWVDCTGEEQARFLAYINAEYRRHA